MSQNFSKQITEAKQINKNGISILLYSLIGAKSRITGIISVWIQKNQNRIGENQTPTLKLTQSEFWDHYSTFKSIQSGYPKYQDALDVTTWQNAMDCIAADGSLIKHQTVEFMCKNKVTILFNKILRCKIAETTIFLSW